MSSSGLLKRFNDYIISLEEKCNAITSMMECSITYGFENITLELSKTYTEVNDDMEYYNQIYDELLDLDEKQTNILEMQRIGFTGNHLNKINTRLGEIDKICFN